jgi:hypothetical protein
VANADGVILVLLNGADEKHEVQFPYRKNRCLIVLEMISSISKDFWNEIDLENIEPFIVLFQNKALFQLRWKEKEKETVTLDVNKIIFGLQRHYPAAIREKRASWFHTFMDQIMKCQSRKCMIFIAIPKKEAAHA